MSGMQPPEDVLAEVTTWLNENWDPDLTVRDWWQRLAGSGWGFPTWPAEWFGRGLPADVLSITDQAFASAGAMGAPAGLGQTMGAHVLMKHGSAQQCARYLPGLADGTEGWCQFFSEPGSGSDLASAQTRAVRDGDEWIVNGQKVWTSGAKTADRGMLLARVDRDVPKHRGLGYFIIAVDQPGIDVRPLRQMDFNAHFNEVFFTDARVADADLIGEPGAGWAAAVTTLAYERSGRAGTVGAGTTAAGTRRDILGQRAGDILERLRSEGSRTALYNPAPAENPLALAREYGRDADPLARQRVAQYESLTRLREYNVERIRATREAGGSPGTASSITKLFRSIMVRTNRDLGPHLLGADGLLAGPQAPHEGLVAAATLHAPALDRRRLR